MSEIWKSVTLKEFSEVYEVSSLGRVKNVVTGKILKPKVSPIGYERVTLCNKGYQKCISIHRLVALAFIPNTENKPTVNHILSGQRTLNKTNTGLGRQGRLHIPIGRTEVLTTKVFQKTMTTQDRTCATGRRQLRIKTARWSVYSLRKRRRLRRVA